MQNKIMETEDTEGKILPSSVFSLHDFVLHDSVCNYWPPGRAVYTLVGMGLDFPNLPWRALRRRLCSGVTLLAYFIAAIGFPLPQTLAHAMNACGEQVCCCGTAVECKASGCGCSHETAPQPESEPPACCKEKPAASCRVKEAPATHEPTKSPRNPKADTVRWVVGIAAQKCRGGATEWVSTAAALPTAAPLTWQPSWPFCYSLPVTHQSFFVLTADLSDPPPRLEAV
jgi:hypothetical protein